MQRLIAAIGLLAIIPTTALADIVWKGDYSTGDLSQWPKIQAVSADRLQIVQSPAHPGDKYTLKVTVVQGDNPIGASGNRNELVNTNFVPDGAEYYYAWSTMFSPDYPSEYTWQVFTQWHQKSDSGSPPIEFDINGETIMLDNDGSARTLWSAPLVRGVWHDFILHVKFSDDPSVGFLELWYDGQHVMDKTYLATGVGDYLKQGLYRNNTIQPTGIVYHTGMTQATALSDVMPPPVTPPPVTPPPATSPAPNPNPSDPAVAQGPSTSPGPPQPGAPSDGTAGQPAAQPTPGATLAGSPPPVLANASAGSSGGGCSATGTTGLSALALVAVAWALRRRTLAVATVRRPRR